MLADDIADLGLPANSTFEDVKAQRNIIEQNPELKEEVNRRANERRSRRFSQVLSELGLPEDAGWKDVEKARLDKQLKLRIERLGLPESATWEDAWRLERKRALRRRVGELGLPEQSTQEDVLLSELNKALAEQISSFGLPADSTWGDILQHRSDLALAKEIEPRWPYGEKELPANTTWENVRNTRGYYYTKDEMRKRFRLPESATWEDIEKAEIARVEARIVAAKAFPEHLPWEDDTTSSRKERVGFLAEQLLDTYILFPHKNKSD